jgi:hypothetical protein
MPRQNRPYKYYPMFECEDCNKSVSSKLDHSENKNLSHNAQNTIVSFPQNENRKSKSTEKQNSFNIGEMANEFLKNINQRYLKNLGFEIEWDDILIAVIIIILISEGCDDIFLLIALGFILIASKM